MINILLRKHKEKNVEGLYFYQVFNILWSVCGVSTNPVVQLDLQKTINFIFVISLRQSVIILHSATIKINNCIKSGSCQ